MANLDLKQENTVPEHLNGIEKNHLEQQQELSTVHGQNHMENSDANLNQNQNVNNNDCNIDNPLLATAVTNLNIKAFKATTKLLSFVIYTSLTLSFFFLGLWILFQFFLKNNNYSNFFNAAFLFGILAFMIFYMKGQSIKQFQKGILERYEFYKNYILQRTLRNGEFVGEMKIYYADIVGKKYITLSQNEGYLVLNYNTKFLMLIVHLKNTPIAEIEQLEKLFTIKILNR